MTKKIHKYLNKRCPECNSKMIVAEYAKEIDGITTVEDFIECTDEQCGYSEELGTNRKRRRMQNEFE